MVRRAWPIAALPLLLAAGPDSLVQPGKWENRVEVIDLEMPNAPVGLAQSMRGRPTTVVTCLKPDQARLGPRALLRADAGCSFSQFDTAGGKLTLRMQCDRPTGKSTIVSDGSYSATGYTIRSRSTMDGARMTIVTRTTGRLIGAC
jgi:hypothetical protein